MSAEDSGWNVSVSLASCAKKIGSRPLRPIGECRQVPWGEIFTKVAPGPGSVIWN